MAAWGQVKKEDGYYVIEKSKLSSSHSSYSGFTVILPKTSEQADLRKIGEKPGKLPGGTQMHYDAVGKQRRNCFLEH